MTPAIDPFRLLLISLAGWLDQQDVIDYLQEENLVLRKQLGGKRLRFSDDQRLRLAVRANKLGWRMLQELTTIVSPATAGLALPADRHEVRWQPAAQPRPSAHSGRDPAAGGPHGHREPGLVLPANPRSTRQPGP